MTPSQYIKEQGLPSLKYVAGKIGKPPQTLQNWYNNNFALFEVVVAGMCYQAIKQAELREAMGEEIWAKIKQGKE